MSPENLSYIRIGFSIASIAFGIGQYISRRRTERLIATEAVELHQNVAVALGAAQAAQIQVQAGTSPAFEIGRAVGVNQAVLHESAKLFCNLKNTTQDDIDDLITGNHLRAQYREIYYAYSSPRVGWIRRCLRRLGKAF